MQLVDETKNFSTSYLFENKGSLSGFDIICALYGCVRKFSAARVGPISEKSLFKIPLISLGDSKVRLLNSISFIVMVLLLIPKHRVNSHRRTSRGGGGPSLGNFRAKRSKFGQ